MATSTLYQSSPLGSPAGSPRSCLYLPRPQTFQPKADWRASFTSTSRDPFPTQVQHTKPLILRQHDGVWLNKLSDISTPTKDPSPQREPQPQTQTPPDPPKAFPISRLSLGRVPKTLRCHVCQATIREQNFQHHLFFGSVRCDLCDLPCNDCRSFERCKKDAEQGHGTCQHNFSYDEDPYDYLLPRLSGSDDMDVGGSLTLPNKLRVMQHYVSQMISIQLQEPWCTAVRKCKSRLLKSHSATPPEPSEEPSPSHEPSGDQLGVKDDVPVSAERASEGTGWQDTLEAQVGTGPVNKVNGCFDNLKAPQEGLTCLRPAPHDSQGEEEEDAGVLLTQNYDLEHLEQAVEYVEVEEQCRSGSAPGQPPLQNKPKKRRKGNQYKKLKAHRLTPPQRKRPSIAPVTEEVDDDEDGLVMEEVALPENGYYLMVREAVEECPMCYDPLSPNQCFVNLRTFLFTVTCSGCGLLIYIVPDLPDGLKIVSGSGGGEVITQSKDDNKHKTSRKVRARDFFAK